MVKNKPFPVGNRLLIKIRDPWANRKLAICARSFSTLPRPAKQLVEHLRNAAQ